MSMPQQSVSSPATSGPPSGGGAMSQQNLNQIVSFGLETGVLIKFAFALRLASRIALDILAPQFCYLALFVYKGIMFSI